MVATANQSEQTIGSGLRVRDIMQRNVVTIDESATVRELADLLLHKQVSGVPVVREDGTVLGVASLWDVVRLAGEETKAPEMMWLQGVTDEERTREFFGRVSPGRPTGHALLRTVRPPLLERHTVRQIMTPAIFHVREETTVADLARYLLASKIHRALVLDKGRLGGIVTATDVLEAMTRESPGSGAPLSGDVED
jgi:CBS domain-containing protein